MGIVIEDDPIHIYHRPDINKKIVKNDTLERVIDLYSQHHI